MLMRYRGHEILVIRDLQFQRVVQVTRPLDLFVQADECVLRAEAPFAEVVKYLQLEYAVRAHQLG